jgi:hypothetical protein
MRQGGVLTLAPDATLHERMPRVRTKPFMAWRQPCSSSRRSLLSRKKTWFWPT